MKRFGMFAVLLLSSCRSGHFDQKQFAQTEPSFKAELISSAALASQMVGQKRLSFILEVKTLDKPALPIPSHLFKVELKNPALKSNGTQELKSDQEGRLVVQAEFDENSIDRNARYETEVIVSSEVYGRQSFSLIFQLNKSQNAVIRFSESSSKGISPAVFAKPKDFEIQPEDAILIGRTEKSDFVSTLKVQVSFRAIDLRTSEPMPQEKFGLSYMYAGQRKSLPDARTDQNGILLVPLDVDVSFYDHERIYEITLEATAERMESKSITLPFNFETNASRPLLKLSQLKKSSENMATSSQEMALEVLRLDRVHERSQVLIDDRLRLFFQPHDELKIKVSLTRNTWNGPSLRELSQVELRTKVVLAAIPSENEKSTHIFVDQLQQLRTNERGETSILLAPKINDLTSIDRHMHLLMALDVPSYLKSSTNFFDIDLSTQTARRLNSDEAKRKLNGILFNEVASSAESLPEKLKPAEFFKTYVSLKELLQVGRENLNHEDISYRDELLLLLSKDWLSQRKAEYWKSIERLIPKILKWDFKTAPELKADVYDFVETILSVPELKLESKTVALKGRTNTSFQADYYDFNFEFSGTRCLAMEMKDPAGVPFHFYFCQERKTGLKTSERFRDIRSPLKPALDNSQSTQAQFEILLRGSKDLSDFDSFEQIKKSDILTHPENDPAGIIAHQVYPIVIPLN